MLVLTGRFRVIIVDGIIAVIVGAIGVFLIGVARAALKLFKLRCTRTSSIFRFLRRKLKEISYKQLTIATNQVSQKSLTKQTHLPERFFRASMQLGEPRFDTLPPGLLC